MWILWVSLYPHGWCFPTFLSYRKHVAKHETVLVENGIYRKCKIFQALFIKALWNTLYKGSYLIFKEAIKSLFISQERIFFFISKIRMEYMNDTELIFFVEFVAHLPWFDWSSQSSTFKNVCVTRGCGNYIPVFIWLQWSRFTCDFNLWTSGSIEPTFHMMNTSFWFQPSNSHPEISLMTLIEKERHNFIISLWHS